MSYITTYTGKHFDPANPEMSFVDIRDIAHALSYEFVPFEKVEQTYLELFEKYKLQ